MAFTMAKVDEDILKSVDIRIIGPAESNEITDTPTEKGVRLNSTNLQFPPKIIKDGKQAEWLEVASGSYEPMKLYVQSHSRFIGLKFEWICGGRFPPKHVHKLVSAMKSYFYGPYFAAGKTKQHYPVVEIHKLYGIISSKSTWRMMDLNINYGIEMCKIADTFYPIHVEVSINLEAVTQLGRIRDEAASEVQSNPYSNFSNLMRKPEFEWY